MNYPKYEGGSKKEVRFIITPEDFSKITERFPESSQYYLPLMIGYYTGLRISETFALTWDDINLEDRSLTVNKITVKRNFGVDIRQAVKKKGKK